jgi:hypothetical protein
MSNPATIVAFAAAKVGTALPAVVIVWIEWTAVRFAIKRFFVCFVHDEKILTARIDPGKPFQRGECCRRYSVFVIFVLS